MNYHIMRCHKYKDIEQVTKETNQTYHPENGCNQSAILIQNVPAKKHKIWMFRFMKMYVKRLYKATSFIYKL